MPSDNSSANEERAQMQEMRDALAHLNYQVQGLADHLREAFDAIDDLNERVYTLEQQETPSLAADKASSASNSSSNGTSRT